MKIFIFAECKRKTLGEEVVCQVEKTALCKLTCLLSVFHAVLSKEVVCRFPVGLPSAKPVSIVMV
jgi:hypothetical protein